MSLELQTHKSIFCSTSSLRCHQNKIKRHIKHKMFYTELLMFSYKLVHFSVLLIIIKGSSSPPDSGSQPQKSCRWMPFSLISHIWPNKVKSSHSVMSDSLQLHGLWPTRLLCPWDFPGESTGMGCHFLLQGIFPTQGSNLSLQHCRYFTIWVT